MTDTLSPAMAWLMQLWQAQRRPTSCTQRVNMSQALQAAIEMRVQFGADDFVWLTTNTQPSYYDLTPFGRAWVGDGETAYRLAIKARNPSACMAIERWKQRPPFLWEGQRLYVGWQGWWEAKQEHVYCTSFREDGSAVVLCSYQHHAYDPCEACRRDRNQQTPKVLHRYTLTPAQVREAAPKPHRQTQTVRP